MPEFPVSPWLGALRVQANRVASSRQITSKNDVVPRGDKDGALWKCHKFCAAEDSIGPCARRHRKSQARRFQHVVHVVKNGVAMTGLNGRRERLPPFVIVS